MVEVGFRPQAVIREYDAVDNLTTMTECSLKERLNGGFRPNADVAWPKRMSIVAAVLGLMASDGNAQIYKWVDSDGRTHYSANKSDASNAKTETLKTESQSSKDPRSSADYWQEQDRKFRERQISRDSTQLPRVTPMPRSLSGGRENGTDASRCALAKDVLSGAIRHGNGAATDKYDRDVAQDNVRTFCH